MSDRINLGKYVKGNTMSILDKIFGTHSDRELKKLHPIADKVLALEEQYAAMTDSELKNMTPKLKERLQNGETLDDIMVDAFATVREVGVRVLGLKAYKVQIIGAIVLHQGRIAEMKTGEGKTLAATMPAYLNGLSGKGVHIVTVNDYLANRDATEMGEIYKFLGLTVGCITNQISNDERKEAYNADITYGTNNEFGFDYLRDNMVIYKKEMVQRELNFAIVDEVDSILIDEARTPLIISGSSSKSTNLYSQAQVLARRMKKGEVQGEISKLSAIMNEEITETGDFVLDEKESNPTLTADGIKKAEEYFQIENLSDPSNMEILHHINIALKANYTMFRDKDYVIKDNEVVIVDEFTGRLMPGRRYSNGIHQAIEAKENVKVQRESKTLATITFQNYFNRYTKLSGMTGTALTEDEEFREIYSLDVIAVPTNMPVIRVDHADEVYKSHKDKLMAIVREVLTSYEKGQPVLVGTVTIESSEEISTLLRKAGIKHNVLNAKFHEREAEIVADAGQFGAVTIATNMAGRGTDIKLGEKVVDAGGLKIVGTERHESRRIDNQLRGRSGRQGDPGESKFFLSLDDDLMRLFGSDRFKKMVERLGLPDGEPIAANILSNAIENAQKKVEGNNFDIRKHLLDYDRVMNEQREIIYEERYKVLDGEDMREVIVNMMKDVITRSVNGYSNGMDHPDEWDMVGMMDNITKMIPMHKIKLSDKEKDNITREKFIDFLYNKSIELYKEKESEFEDVELLREAERVVVLKSIDSNWMEHIDNMDQMRQGISLRAYAQKDPLVEYKFVGYEMFDEMIESIQENTVRAMFSLRPKNKLERERVAKVTGTNHADASMSKTIVRADKKVYPNQPCPCGSGKKFKHCHGRK